MASDAVELRTVTGPECLVCSAFMTGISACAPGRRTLEPCGHETGFLPAGELRERMYESERILTDNGVPAHVDGDLAEAVASIPDAGVERINQ